MGGRGSTLTLRRQSMLPNKPLLPTPLRGAAERQSVRQAGALPGEMAPAGRPADHEPST
jgi:hypothetical protein